MKTLIIYTSQTGFTKRYAEWLAERMSGDLLDLRDAKKKSADYFEDYDAICYGGWAMAGNLVKGKWFLEKAVNWQDKLLQKRMNAKEEQSEQKTVILLSGLMFLAAFIVAGLNRNIKTERLNRKKWLNRFLL